MISGLLQKGIPVRDVDAALSWYCGVLGFELVLRQHRKERCTPVGGGVSVAGLEIAQIRFPSSLPRLSSHDVELIQQDQDFMGGSASRPGQVGLAHLTLLVEDIERVHARATSRGARFRTPPTLIARGVNEGGYACHLHDLDGNTVEVVQPPPPRLEVMRSLLAWAAEHP